MTLFSLRCFSWNVLGHCFVTNEVFWRFQKLSMPRFEPQKRDLQSETGPGASGAQKNMKNRKYFQNTSKILQKMDRFFFKKTSKKVKSLQNGSGVVEIRSNFVRMFSYGSRMPWDRFLPKINEKKHGKNRKYRKCLSHFLPFSLVFPGFPGVRP